MPRAAPFVDQPITFRAYAQPKQWWRRHRSEMRYLVVGTRGAGKSTSAEIGNRNAVPLYRTGFALLGSGLASCVTRAVQALHHQNDTASVLGSG